MAEEQTDWLACGARKCRAQRVNEILEAKEADRRAQLHLRRIRLRHLLEEEQEILKMEMDQRIEDFKRRQHEERLAEIAALREREETERAKQVHLADEMRRRQQCHQYREAYTREVQRYINETRQHEITLRNQMRKHYGVNAPPGKGS
ncbi:trichohyalin-like [Penaeus japonicus]|uniref:trichohyalin-like n=1 Tax=Penaeus japonicus TaxID=27405 RepID=UPI001C7116FE|nr:trichohyalin-like [Penaeus japonicus]